MPTPRLNPKVSVVIPESRDRPLYEESLKRQDYPNYEILPIRGCIAFEARNIGINRANGEIVAFIDDDVELPYRWMSTGVKLLEETGADIVGGPNIGFPTASIAERISDFLISSGIFNGFRKKFKRNNQSGFSDYRNFATCNIMMRKSVFGKAGDFSEKYRYAEDMEFLLRCSIKGLSLYFSPDLFLYHRRRSFPFGHIKQMFFWGSGNMQMALDYPFVLKRPDIWGSLILIPASLLFLWLYFKLAVIMGVVLLPVVLHFLSYALGVTVKLITSLIGMKKC